MNTSPPNRFRALVLSKDMSTYRGAYYQQDFLSELSNQAECFFYGPGFADYSLGKSLSQILRESSFNPDFVLTAHSFLEDNPQKPLERIPGIQLSSATVPIFSILNKEYSRLAEKIAFFSDIGSKAIYTHHHNLEGLTEKIELPHLFFPFGVDPFRFRFAEKTREYDFGFSGLLKNPSFGAMQADTRVEIMRKVYFTALGTPLRRRPEYHHLKVIWKSWTGRPLVDLIGKFLGHGKLSEEGYVGALGSTKAWINAPSPLGIVSTRYFECMASGSFVIAQNSPGLEKLFPSHLMATFEDVTEFSAILESTLSDEAKLQVVTREARDFVLLNHTWKIRVKQMLESVARLI